MNYTCPVCKSVIRSGSYDFCEICGIDLTKRCEYCGRLNCFCDSEK